MIVEKKPERSYSTTVMYILAYLDRYGYPVLILIAGALADFYRGRITMLFVLAVGILLDGIYNLVAVTILMSSMARILVGSAMATLIAPGLSGASPNGTSILGGCFQELYSQCLLCTALKMLM